MSRKRPHAPAPLPAVTAVADNAPGPLANAATGDGFANFTARLGHGAQNLGSSGTYVIGELLTRNPRKLEAMFRQSWVCQAVVVKFAEDMVRAGVTLTTDRAPTDEKRIQRALTRLGVWSGLLDLIQWGRLYGGAVAYMDIDGQDPSSPLDLETIGAGQFRGLRVYDRHLIAPDLTALIQTGPSAGLPVYYDLVSDPANGQATRLRFHYSRVVRYDGVRLPRLEAVRELLWGLSVLEPMFDRLLSFDSASAGAANLVHRAYLRTVRVKDLRRVLAAGGVPEENLLKFFRMVSYLQSSEGLTVFDADDEFSTQTYAFAGLDDVLLSFGQQLSGATGIPLVRLFGQSPKGLNATGESDMRLYYDAINAQQESRLRDPMTTLLEVVHRSVLGEAPGPEFDFEFQPLWQTSTKEKAEIAGKKAETIERMFTAGVIERATALRELRQQSDETGMFQNVTDEDIAEAEAEEAAPPAPVLSGNPADPESGDPAVSGTPAPAESPGGMEAAMARIQAFLEATP